MTEADWYGPFDLEGVLWNLEAGLSAVLPHRPSDRKLRLFAVACIRRLGGGGPGEGAILSAIERDADAVTNPGRGRVKDTRRAAQGLYRGAGVPDPDGRQVLFDAVVRRQAAKAAHDVNGRCRSFDAGDGGGDRRSLLRDIFGNPFRPVTISPAWLNPTVVALADAIYEDRAFDRLPVLADALEEAGCDNQDVLAHCRSGGVHVRGCWVVDLLLVKE